MTECGDFVDRMWRFCGQNVEILWTECGDFVDRIDQTDKSTIWSVVMTNTDQKLVLDKKDSFRLFKIPEIMTHQLNSWDDVYITLELAPERCAVEFRQSFKVLLISGLHSCV
ncbi:hypothetical protein ACF0H5_008201 [Mactra antiquata]